MTRGKAIAAGLAGAALLLGVLAALQVYGLGKGYSLEPATLAGGREQGPAALEREPVRMRPWTEYGEVLARPLFNESRAPEEAPPTEGDATATTAALNVALTGVVITADVRIAMVKDNASGKTVRVKLGQPLEGDQAGWTLAELKPRGAVFDGGDLGRQELELTIDTKGAPAPEGAPPAQPNQTTAMAPLAPPPNTVPAPGTAPAAAPAETQPQAATAEDIRRRIEERRRQLREEAQRMLEQGQNEKQ